MTTHLMPFASPSPVTAADLLASATGGSAGSGEGTRRFPTGMHPLDDVLGGGFRAQDLVTLTGKPGVGKTIMALQWARWLAKQNVNAIYVCYEHSPHALLARLAALEAASAGLGTDAPTVDALARDAHDFLLGARNAELGSSDPRLADVLARLGSYAANLTFVQGSRRVDIDAIDRLALERTRDDAVVFVDYLQKVPVRGRDNELERTSYLAESLKDLAITRNVGVVAIAAADRDALRARRLRLFDMRGSSSLAYEADLALVMNEKAVAVSKSHLAFDPVRAESFKRQVVVSIEKNRGGPSNLDIEFTRDYAHYRIDPDGAFMVENLVDDVLYID